MSDRSGPGILGIALAVALGIGIAHDEGWTGNDAEAAPADTTESVEQHATGQTPGIALKP